MPRYRRYRSIMLYKDYKNLIKSRQIKKNNKTATINSTKIKSIMTIDDLATVLYTAMLMKLLVV